MSRRQLSSEARQHRKKLYSGTSPPTESEKWRVYDEIVELYGFTEYTRRQHSNWCTGRARERLKSPRYLIATKLHSNPNPTALDIACWALEIRIKEVDAFRLVGELLQDVVKAQTAFEYSLNDSQLAMPML